MIAAAAPNSYRKVAEKLPKSCPARVAPRWTARGRLGDTSIDTAIRHCLPMSDSIGTERQSERRPHAGEGVRLDAGGEGGQKEKTAGRAPPPTHVSPHPVLPLPCPMSFIERWIERASGTAVVPVPWTAAAPVGRPGGDDKANTSSYLVWNRVRSSESHYAPLRGKLVPVTCPTRSPGRTMRLQTCWRRASGGGLSAIR
jgi:hypothetical protein